MPCRHNLHTPLTSSMSVDLALSTCMGLTLRALHTYHQEQLLPASQHCVPQNLEPWISQIAAAVQLVVFVPLLRGLQQPSSVTIIYHNSIIIFIKLINSVHSPLQGGCSNVMAGRMHNRVINSSPLRSEVKFAKGCSRSTTPYFLATR